MTADTSAARTFPGFCREFFTRRMPVWLLCVVLAAGVVLGAASADVLDRPVSGARVAAGAVAFLCAFLLLRIVDDIDDEAGGRPLWTRAALGTERRLGALGLLVLGVLVATGTYSGTALLTLVGVACVPLASFVVRPHLAPHDREPLRVRSGLATAALGVVYEGAPAVIIAAVPIGLGAARLVPVALLCWLFWSGYETYKFGRAVGRPGWHPYGLGSRGIAVGLAALAGADVVAVTALWTSGFFPAGVAVLLGGAFAGVAGGYARFAVLGRRPAAVFLAALRFLPLGLVIAGTATALVTTSSEG